MSGLGFHRHRGGEFYVLAWALFVGVKGCNLRCDTTYGHLRRLVNQFILDSKLVAFHLKVCLWLATLLLEPNIIALLDLGQQTHNFEISRDT